MKFISDLSEKKMIDGLVRMAPHARIVSHVPGRIRLKFSMEGVTALNGKGNMENPIDIPGILRTRINKFARSIIVEYDHKKIPYDLWERLGRIGKDPNEAKSVVRDLRKIFLAQDSLEETENKKVK